MEYDEYLTIDVGFWDLKGNYIEDIQKVERSEVYGKDDCETTRTHNSKALSGRKNASRNR